MLDLTQDRLDSPGDRLEFCGDDAATVTRVKTGCGGTKGKGAELLTTMRTLDT